MPRILSVAILSALFALGCASSPLNGTTSASQKISAIEIHGTRNLGNAHVRVTNPEQIERLMSLVRDVRSGLVRTSVSLDVSTTKVVELRIIRDHEQTSLTLVNGLMLVPDVSGDEFYDIENPAQAKLWNLVLQLLNAAG